jgi:hypothetical protein
MNQSTDQMILAVRRPKYRARAKPTIVARKPTKAMVPMNALSTTTVPSLNHSKGMAGRA